MKTIRTLLIKSKVDLNPSKAFYIQTEENKKKYFKTDSGLEQQSPNYNALIEKIGSIDGTSILYSDYRMVESLPIVRMR